MSKLHYRLALDLGPTSLGWAVVRLTGEIPPVPVELIKTGVRIFGDGRRPKDKASLAVTRREARSMRRRRDRFLKRKARMMHTLVQHGFFPQDPKQLRELETLNPYELRARGLEQALQPGEFARALFHINQRRGFKSNRKTDSRDSDSGLLKTAIQTLRETLAQEQVRTVGEWLYKRYCAHQTVRARYRENSIIGSEGSKKTEKSYDLYIDRAMVEEEFDTLWSKQAQLNPALFTEQARSDLKYCLLYQRPLKPVRPGRCVFLPDEERAPLALPSQQRFRIYQEVNHLRVLEEGLREGEPLARARRDALVQALERGNQSFASGIPKLLGLPGGTQFNLADVKRKELKGNATSMVLGKPRYFGEAWFHFDAQQQDQIVMQLCTEENESVLIRWLMENTAITQERALAIADVRLPDGYGSLSAKALARILPELEREVQTYDKAARAAGFHHSRLGGNEAIPGRTFAWERVEPSTGEINTFHIFHALPYYGEFLQRHVGFADPKASADDLPEKRFGRIANPTVHIGLNQIRVVVNALLKRYGHPAEVVVEVARDLKQNKQQRDEQQKQQAHNQKRNERLRQQIATVLQTAPEQVRFGDIQKMILWEELSKNPAQRCCPYSGIPISPTMLLSDQVETEHILPFSKTLDDSLNNKTVAMRHANRIKGNRTPWEARHDFAAQGWSREGLEERSSLIEGRNKRYRFGEAAMQLWDKEGKGFLARALNDTRHLSRVAREYMELVCPQATRVIPGQMTALLRAKFGLNDILGLHGEKNRNDHRHHAVDACVIAVTDQALLQRFANASQRTEEKGLNRLVEKMPDPWPLYRNQVKFAIEHTWVSHKPDHAYQGAMHDDTAYGLQPNGRVRTHKHVDGRRVLEEKPLKVIEISDARAHERHGTQPDGSPRPYKGYKGNSNYCIEIVHNEKGKWQGEVISTFEAYQIVRQWGEKRLRHPRLSISEKPLIMRLMIGDMVRIQESEWLRTLRVVSINSAGNLTLAEHHEANTDARNRDSSNAWRYTNKVAGSLQKSRGRKITISPDGQVRDPGFTG
ncbi:CRISPR-associated endonuclease, Csn1 family [Lampropedia hyalina DSM 16112]|jgi:CRISPR-associated endonuclease Csn1|uniref:CRISPR-associated endonuclease Cas9 n=1 Tax=Lampropedia hyalina DSM 16112 TaxID=1122156 RepID=A0A1M4USV7_9BURK|nr:type II CRISPR RNA-guided endonuclease Cas9 [Lampropedia hyalina]SHE59690.1 CRISPR-associated endonuclease, Csn1 family [Lampropedia hyalina DSM 16112]